MQTGLLDDRTRVGLFGLKSDNTFAFDNYKYKGNGQTDILVPDEGTEAPSAPDAGTQIIACAPYGDSFKDLPEDGSFQVQTDQSTDEGYLNSDLLWGEASTIDANGTAVIPMERKLCRWMFTITLTGGLKASDFQGATLALYDAYTKVGFNPRTGETGTASNCVPVDFLKIADDNEATTFTAMALLPPQEFTKDYPCYIRLTLKDGTQTYFRFDPLTIASGYHYRSNVIFNGYPTNIQATIQTWQDGGKNTGYMK